MKEQIEKLIGSYRNVVTMTFWRAVELKVLAKYLHHLDGSIVDIGCGDGSIASLLFGNNKISDGFDVEKQAVQQASKGAYQAVVVADARNIPFRDAIFDSLFSNSAIEHFFEIDKCYYEFHRISKAGSFFLFTVISNSFYSDFWCSSLSSLGLGKFSKMWIKRHRRLRQHLNVWQLDKWKDFLEKHGFSLVASEFYFNPQAMFWWSLLEDAHTWPFKFGVLVTAISKLVPKKVLYSVGMTLVREDENLCNKFGRGAGLLLLARKKY